MNKTLPTNWRFKDLTGRRFNRLVVKSFHGIGNGHQSRWECVCDCGAIVIVRQGSLKFGTTKSCGCFNLEIHRTHGRAQTKDYHSWEAMWQRCTNPKCRSYKNYGARGISICERWKSFANFFADMGQCPKGLTIERTNNELGYSPTPDTCPNCGCQIFDPFTGKRQIHFIDECQASL